MTIATHPTFSLRTGFWHGCYNTPRYYDDEYNTVCGSGSRRRLNIWGGGEDAAEEFEYRDDAFFSNATLSRALSCSCCSKKNCLYCMWEPVSQACKNLSRVAPSPDRN